MYLIRWLLSRLAVCAFLAIGAGVGVMFAYAGSGIVDRADTLAERGVTTTGTVLEHRTVTSRDADGDYTTSREMLIEFGAPPPGAAPDAPVDQVRHRFWTGGQRPVGSQIQIVYDREDPDSAITGSPGTHRVIGIVLIVIGSGFAAVWVLGPIIFWLYDRDW